MRSLAGTALAVLVSSVVAVSAVHAGATLRLTDSGLGVTVVVADGGGLDGDTTAGMVTYIGGVGGNWAVNVTSGLSKPVLGSAVGPDMDLNSVNVTSVGAGTLTIEFSDNFFGPLPGGYNFKAKIGGTTKGTVTYSTFADPGNALFAQTIALTSQGPFGAGAFSGTAFSGAIAGAFPYALTQVATVAHSGAGQTSSFDAGLQAVRTTTTTPTATRTIPPTQAPTLTPPPSGTATAGVSATPTPSPTPSPSATESAQGADLRVMSVQAFAKGARGTPPVQGEPAVVEVTVANRGDAVFARTTGALVGVWVLDVAGEGDVDMQLVERGPNGEVGMQAEVLTMTVPKLQPGALFTLRVRMTFATGAFADRLEVTVIAPGDRNLNNNTLEIPFRPAANPRTLINCSMEIMTVASALVLSGADRSAVQVLADLAKIRFFDAPRLAALLQAGQYYDAGKTLFSGLITGVKDVLKLAGRAVLSTILGVLQNAYNEWNRVGCGEGLPEMWGAVKAMTKGAWAAIAESANALNMKFWGWLIGSPVNLRVSTGGGEELVLLSDGTFQTSMTDAVGSLARTQPDVKLAMALGDGPFDVTYQGTGVGVATVDVLHPSSELVSTLASYENISVTPTFSATATLDPSAPAFELHVDTDGDGIEDATIGPDTVGVAEGNAAFRLVKGKMVLDRGKLRMRGELLLGPQSDGIAPDRERVAVALNGQDISIPAGGFRFRRGAYVYKWRWGESSPPGIRKIVLREKGAAGRYRVKIVGDSLSGVVPAAVAGPTALGIQVGDDLGVDSNTFDERRTGTFVFKGPKHPFD